MKGRKLVAVLMAVAMTFSLAACKGTGSVTTDTEGTGSNEKKLTVDVFDSYANYQGLQSGWFGKLLKDNFNIELNIIAPNVAGGGDTLYQTRSASGDLGDLIIVEKADMKDCIESGLVLDITDYMDDCKYLPKYQTAIDSFAEYAGTGDSVYAIPTTSSLESALDPALEQGRLNTASYMVFDYYKEIGCPEITDMDSLLDVLEQMVNAHPTNDDGDKSYAFSLYKEWDSCSMFLAERICANFGYAQTVESYLTNGDITEKQLLLDDSGIYKQALKLYFEANQRGLLDPDSASQNFDTMSTKITSKQAMYIWWGWMLGYYNSTENTSKGMGYAYVPITGSKIVTPGKNPYGSDGLCIAVGANASEPERLIEMLDWMASPEGQDYLCLNVKDVTYTEKDGQRIQTEFGLTGYAENRNMPEEWGGGGYQDGECKLNTRFAPQSDTNPETGEPYSPNEWSSTREILRQQLDEDWTAQYGAQTLLDYVKEKDMLSVMPGNTWVRPSEDTELQLKRTQCDTLIVETSWQMVYASDEAEFEQLWSDMKTKLTGFGYDDVVAADTEYLAELKTAIDASVASSEK